jgi:light-regulated signal transduction histidine kinase (bacteriophytochrome)
MSAGAYDTPAPLHKNARTQEEVLAVQPDTDLIVFASPRLERALHLPEGELKGRRLRDLASPHKLAAADFEEIVGAGAHDVVGLANQASALSTLLCKRYGAQVGQDGADIVLQLQNTAERLNQFVCRIRQFSHVLTQPLRLRATDANPILTAAVSRLERSIITGNAHVFPDHLPTVFADPEKLIMIFEQLIDNAIKFRNSSDLRIQVKAHRVDGAYTFALQDNGIGIPPDKLQKVFLPFIRAHGHQYDGAGMGLAIARAIVEQHGGTIWVESEVGQGSTFFFTLPDTSFDERSAAEF